MKKTLLFLLFAFLSSSFCLAQNKINIYEDSLKNLGIIFTGDTLQEHRNEANALFIKTLVTALKEPESFNYPFQKLQNYINIQASEDKSFRIFSWFNQNNDGTYRYFGAIQKNNPSKLELYPLFDNTQNLKNKANLADSTLKTNEWFGAVYYQIVPVLNIKEPYFLLLGWKGKNAGSSSKVIETLRFIDGKPSFGLAVLETASKSNQFSKRIIFDYSSNASVLLKYMKDEKLLVFDHLVSENEQSKDFFVPDLSYDGYKIKVNKWLFQENLKLKNPPTENDDFFIDPSNPTNIPIIK